ncbi:MAG: hypothetical protein LBT86_03220 [Deltaproteobacteria bacterium]|jgi:flagellar biosynthesis component FlhA|nr:hypothetical protein [Deltaproteobacteria bacterium]
MAWAREVMTRGDGLGSQSLGLMKAPAAGVLVSRAGSALARSRDFAPQRALRLEALAKRGEGGFFLGLWPNLLALALLTLALLSLALLTRAFGRRKGLPRWLAPNSLILSHWAMTGDASSRIIGGVKLGYAD